MNQPSASHFTEAQFNEIRALIELRVAAAVAEFYAARKPGPARQSGTMDDETRRLWPHGSISGDLKAASGTPVAATLGMPEYVRYGGCLFRRPAVASDTQAEADALDAGVS